MSLTREQIFNAEDLKRETVEVPEWGGSVIVSTMTGLARDAFEASIITTEGRANLQNMRAKLVAATVIDESGKLLFSPGDVLGLGAKSATALDRIVTVAQRLNRLSDAQLEDLKGN